jgi:hypothetical protein
MISGFSVEAIRPLVQSSKVDGRALDVTFVCPVTGNQARTRWTAPPIGASAILTQMRTSPLFHLRKEVNQLIRNTLGFGAIARAARQLSDATLAGQHPIVTFNAEEEERALLEAFRLVSFRFAWVDDRWVHASLKVDADQRPDTMPDQLERGGTLCTYDRNIAGRMMIAVARAHGDIADEERAYLTEVFDGDTASLASLLARPQLTHAEFAETTPGEPRRALFGMAWAVALCDEDFHAQEAAMLDSFADGLKLDRHARDHVQNLAQVYLLEQYLERMAKWGKHDKSARTQLYKLAEKVGLSRATAQRVEARFLKRRGL